MIAYRQVHSRFSGFFPGSSIILAHLCLCINAAISSYVISRCVSRGIPHQSRNLPFDVGFHDISKVEQAQVHQLRAMNPRTRILGGFHSGQGLSLVVFNLFKLFLTMRSLTCYWQMSQKTASDIWLVLFNSTTMIITIIPCGIFILSASSFAGWCGRMVVADAYKAR